MESQMPPGERRPGAAWWAVVSSGLSPVLLVAGFLVAGAVQAPLYNPLRQSISVLAGHGGTHRWIMTTALFAIGCCHFITAAGMYGVRWPAPLLLAAAGVAAIGVAAFPEPVHGYAPPHITLTVIGVVLVAIWPALVGYRRRRSPLALTVRASAVATLVLVGLLIWLAVETRVGGRLGLAERVSSSVQLVWPFVVAIALRMAPRCPVGRDAGARRQMYSG